MAQLSKITKVSDSFTINRYDNGWMAEISGRTKDDDWTTAKIMCNTEDELIALIKEYNTMVID